LPAGTTLIEAYGMVDQYIEGAEKVLQLKAPKHMTIVLTKEWSGFHRLMPHMRSRGIRAVTLATGTVIYVTPKIEERKFDHREFVRHEITHAVINQNQSFLHAFQLTDVQWLFEGLAVSYGDQKAYLSREEFLARARKEELLPVIDPARRTPGTFDMQFAYPTWRYFCEFLMEHYGRDRFQQFLLATMSSPKSWRGDFSGDFSGVFGEPLETAVAFYQNRVRSVV
jgi:hypothetical protein